MACAVHDHRNNLKPITLSKNENISYNGNNTQITNEKKIKEFSIVLKNRKEFEELRPKLKHIAGYKVDLYMAYPDDESIIRFLSSKSYKATKECYKQSLSNNRSKYVSIDVLTSLLDNLNLFFSTNIETSITFHNPNESTKNEITNLLDSFIKCFKIQKEINFQNVAKAFVMFDCLLKNLSLRENTELKYKIKNEEDHERFLFIELVALSDIFFFDKSMNEKLFSHFEGIDLINLHENQISFLFDAKRKTFITKSNNIYFPVNFLNGKFKIQDNSIEFMDIDGRMYNLTVEKKERGICSGFIINYFNEGVQVKKLFCKELFCCSDEYQGKYQSRVEYYQRLAKNLSKPLSIARYSQLANMCHQIPPYSKYEEMRHKFMANKFVIHFNTHVELFGYYLLKNLKLCPDFTVYRSEFDSKTYIIMESLNEDFKFCRDIDPDYFCNSSIKEVVNSAYLLHYLKVIHHIFVLSDFHESNVALIIKDNIIESINVIDLWPAHWPIEFDQISNYESIEQMMEGHEFSLLSEEIYLIERIYVKLQSFDEQKKSGDLNIDDIMITKRWRFTMLTYRMAALMFNELVSIFLSKKIKYDNQYSLCCFSIRTLFDEVCEEISTKQLISGEFEHKDEYINIVMGITSLLIHQFVEYVTDDSLDHNFSLYRAIFIRKEDSENWNKSAKHEEDGTSYLCTNWRRYLHEFIQPNTEILFIYATKSSSTFESMLEYSKKKLEKNPKLQVIWLISALAFDICINYYCKCSQRFKVFTEVFE